MAFEVSVWGAVGEVDSSTAVHTLLCCCKVMQSSAVCSCSCLCLGVLNPEETIKASIWLVLPINP
jgi:hypothetical protein